MMHRIVLAYVIVVLALSSPSSALASPDGGDAAIATHDLESIREELNADRSALRQIKSELDVLSAQSPDKGKAKTALLDEMQLVNNRKVRVEARIRDLIDRLYNRELQLAYAYFPEGPLDVFVEGMPGGSVNEITFRGIIAKDGIRIAQFSGPNGAWSFPLERIIAVHGAATAPTTRPSK